MVKLENDNPKSSRLLLGWLLLALLLMTLGAIKACAQTAQIDTMLCKVECIKKFVQTTTEKGKTKVFAVYEDRQNDISDLIPVSQTVYTYIVNCRANSIEPHLGIRLRNGQITSIIRYRPKYIRRL